MTDLTVYRQGPRKTRKLLEHAIKSGTVPFVQSSPGLGKSAIIRGIGEKFNLKVIDHRLSTSTPEDLSGLPHFVTDDQGRSRATFSPFNLFPIEGDELPAGKDGWLLFLDEFNSAPKSVQAAAYKLILDRQVGQHNLHPNIVVACAGNLMTDKAITIDLSTAMQSRVVHLEMQLSHSDWIQDVAIKMGYDTRIIAFLSYNKDALYDFKPDHSNKTFSCPRTWEFMNRQISGVSNKELDDLLPLLAGTITSGTALEFVQFTKVFNDLPNIKEVLADPENCKLPKDNPTRWASIMHLLDNLDEKTLAPISVYIDRYNSEFRILFFRSVMQRHPKLRTHPDFARAIINLSHWLNEDDA